MQEVPLPAAVAPVAVPVPTDGRTLRSLRTREAIVDATIALLEEGDLKPTAPRVAERASVSVRSVFQHFDDLESLHAAVAERLATRLSALVLPISVDLPLDDRLARFVHQRGVLLDALAPIRRAADVHGPFSTEITARLRDGQAFLRAEVEVTFAPELAAAGADREDLLDALDATVSWGTWTTLRSAPGRDQASATRVMQRMAAAVLSS
ncbi:MAG TPA: TetR/AcrR family transcriptional regulator [Acidimicrobiales bacterium]|nr:TetR/AcrR family transcriptional regulator [Acidimicrobiales bacterium]